MSGATTRMRIGELAARADVSHRTIHYYERIGLMPPGDRAGRGYRYYDETAVQRLWLIGRLKQLGLSLDEIKGVIDLYFEDTSGVQGKRQVLDILRGHLAETDAKIESLTQFRAELTESIERMEGYLSEALAKSDA